MTIPRASLFLASLFFAATVATAHPGTGTGDALRFGTSTALSGPAANLGREMSSGVQAAFDEVNARGGIRGRQIELIAYDDGYEPKETVPNMRRLIETESVLAIVGNVGTPTAVAAIPIAVEGKTPFIFAYTGAGVLRHTPPEPYVINFRASYAEETTAMVEALIVESKLLPTEIGFFTQRDAYGDAGFSGGATALERHGLLDRRQIAHGRYERNSLAVENALADLMLATPPVKAVVMVGTYAPCAKFIRLARESGLDAIFLNVSFVGATSMARSLGEQGDGVIVTQVVPHFDSALPLAKQYRKAMSVEGEESTLSFVSFEGYVAGRILCRALYESRGELDRPGIVDALLGLGEFDLGLGVPLELSARSRQASHAVWATVIRGGEVLPFEWKELRSVASQQ